MILHLQWPFMVSLESLFSSSLDIDRFVLKDTSGAESRAFVHFQHVDTRKSRARKCFINYGGQ